MIYSEYYQYYKGPSLIKATLNETENITELIQKFYGENNDWNGKLWTYQDIFKDNCQGNKFYCEFKDKGERVHWFQGIINKEKEYLNIPLHTPMSQL